MATEPALLPLTGERLSQKTLTLKKELALMYACACAGFSFFGWGDNKLTQVHAIFMVDVQPSHNHT